MEGVPVHAFLENRPWPTPEAGCGPESGVPPNMTLKLSQATGPEDTPPSASWRWEGPKRPQKQKEGLEHPSLQLPQPPERTQWRSDTLGKRSSWTTQNAPPGEEGGFGNV